MPRWPGRCRRCWPGPRAGRLSRAAARSAARRCAGRARGRAALGVALRLLGRDAVAARLHRRRLPALARRRRAWPARCRPGPGCCRSRCWRCVYPMRHLARRAAVPDARRRAARPRATLRRCRPAPACSMPAAAWATRCVELRREYPSARAARPRVELAAAPRLRLALPLRATVRRADIWAADWSGYDLVYLFQRPESMPRAAAKAARELRPGAWLASLEFPGAGPDRRAVARAWRASAASGSTARRSRTPCSFARLRSAAQFPAETP